MDYTKHVSTKITPQSEKVFGTDQIKNEAGGYVWAVDDWTRLDRFLVLGTEGGTYYASEKSLTVENAEVVNRCLQADPKRTIDRICEISHLGRAPKNDPAIFALAMACGSKDNFARKYALNSLCKVVRTGSHLLMFASFVTHFRGWGRGLRDAIKNWYGKDIDDLTYQVIKYRNRNNWTHRDLFRLAHPIVTSDDHKRVGLYKWITHPDQIDNTELPRLLENFIDLQNAKSVTEVVKLLAQNKSLSWEMIPTEFLKDPGVWSTLLPNMPLMAMVRNLGRMTTNGTLKAMSTDCNHIISKLADREYIHKSRLHPIAILAALKTYESGHGVRGSLSWTPVKTILDALDDAFYLAFDNVEPTGKRTLIGLDVSGSMTCGGVAGISGLTPKVASAALCLVTVRTESLYDIMAFTSNNLRNWFIDRNNQSLEGIQKINFTKKSTLSSAMRMTENLPFGGTDCALPMLYALKNKIDVDTFIIYTDSETWAGKIHPFQALKDYRKQTGIMAKLVVVGMTSNGFSIADPNDAGMLDVVGFDTATPNIIADFSRG